MTLPRTWVLKTVTDGGPVRRSVLEAYAEHHGAEKGKAVIDDLLKSGEVEVIVGGKHARIGLPGSKLRSRKIPKRGKRS